MTESDGGDLDVNFASSCNDELMLIELRVRIRRYLDLHRYTYRTYRDSVTSTPCNSTSDHDLLLHRLSLVFYEFGIYRSAVGLLHRKTLFATV